MARSTFFDAIRSSGKIFNIHFRLWTDNALITLSAVLSQKKMEKENRSAYAKRGISHIKCGPVNAADIDIYKIDHLTESQAIHKIPCSASEKEGQSNEQVRVNLLGGNHYPGYANQSGY